MAQLVPKANLNTFKHSQISEIDSLVKQPNHVINKLLEELEQTRIIFN